MSTTKETGRDGVGRDGPAHAVVVGVDGSEGAERALHWAADHALLEGRTLDVVHAVVLPGMAGIAWAAEAAMEAGRLLRALEEQGEHLLAGIRAGLAESHPGLDVTTSVVCGDPREILLDRAADAALLVIGSRGRGPVRSLLLGSVGLALARHAGCPTVVVRPAPAGPRDGVLVGADADAESGPVLELAYRYAAAHGLPLTVLHCVWDLTAATTRPHVVPLEEDPLEESRLALAEAVAGLAERYPDVSARVEIARGHADRCLLDLAHTMDLVVVGRSDAAAGTRILLGDYAAAVVERAPCPVAVVPTARRGDV